MKILMITSALITFIVIAICSPVLIIGGLLVNIILDEK